QRSCSLSWSPRYEPFLVECRLREVCHVVRHIPCKELVTTLLERWRPETNTFHLVQGEATITLEDVEILTGLPTQGLPVLVALDERTYRWGSAVLTWLYKVMGRAAFFTGGSLRGTGDIEGFTLLVELWALERFPRIAERYIDGGDLPLDDSIPRGMRWLPIIERHHSSFFFFSSQYPCFFHTFQWMPYADRAPEYALHGDLV
ncbi:Protein MAIN-LIKE 2, partial [Linum perenne]